MGFGMDRFVNWQLHQRSVQCFHLDIQIWNAAVSPLLSRIHCKFQYGIPTTCSKFHCSRKVED
ncbi:hypothetical protein T08_7577 [Trichinella sp. T8]|nr:hypothetical protein T08_7577 [Trichinella sp. T8]